jgi:AraC-like DNA-binding protein
MPPIPLVRASHIIPITEFLNQIGSPTNRLLSQCNLAFPNLENPETLLPLYKCCEFIETAAHFEGIELLGYLVGQQTPINKLGMTGQIICNSLTLFDLLVTLEQIMCAANSGFPLSLCWEKDCVWVQFHCDHLPHATNLQSQYYSTTLIINALRLALGKTWRPSELYLEGPPSRPLLAMDEFSGVYIHFLSPQNRIKVPRSALALPINSAAAAEDWMMQPDFKTYLQTGPAQDFVGSLKQTIRALLPRGYPDIALTAEVAGTSKRKLQRQLTKAEESYSHLVELVRYEEATKLLKQPDLKLIEIAVELGYTDAANFTRAFKRWTSMSPSEFRAVNGVGDTYCSALR